VRGPLTPGGLRVCREMCSDCVFRPGNLMRLRPGRVRGMVRDAIRDDSFIPCHQTLDDEQAVCRGFYDRFGDRTLGCRLGHFIGVIDAYPEER
jgi:hypothetical protein